MSYKFSLGCGGHLVYLTVPNDRDEALPPCLHGLSFVTARRLYQELGEALLQAQQRKEPFHSDYTHSTEGPGTGAIPIPGPHKELLVSK